MDQGWGDDLHDVHRRTMLNGDCDTCHGAQRYPVLLNNSIWGGASPGTGLPGLACVGCHGRVEDRGDTARCVEGADPLTNQACGDGAGLRRHHFNAGQTICADCHADADPNNPLNFTPVGEHIPPPYYFTPDAAHPAKPTDPCSPNGEENFAGATTGLDNDGDNLYDTADPDCQPRPDIDVSPLVLDFGVVTVGITRTLTTTISNVGAADLTVTDLNLTGSLDFTLGAGAPAVPFTVPVGATVDVPVDYTPGEEGGDSGTLVIGSNDPDEPTVSVSLTGSGTPPVGGDCVISVNPLSLDFGQVLQGDTLTLTTTITNNSADTDCNVSALTFTGSADFDLNPGAPATPFIVPPLGSTDVPVDYNPSDAGQDSGTLDIASDDPVNPVVSVSLAGEGIAAICDIDVNPLTLDFGPVNVGETATLSTAIGNTGTIDCTVNSLTISGSLDFALNPGAPLPPFPVAPGATVQVPVDYTPSDASADSGTLDIGSDDPDENPVSVALSGTGSTRICSVSPLTLDFGNVELGAVGTLSTTVTNPAGSPTRCTVNTISFDNPEFTLSPTTPLITPFNVWPGNSVDVVVEYMPVDLGTDNNTMTLNITDADRVTVFDAFVGLTGSGVPPVGPPDIDVNPLALDFGAVNIGNSATLTTTISNLGGSDLTVTGLSFSVGSSPDFELGPGAPTVPFVVPVGGSAYVPVDYMPFDEGADTGTLEITSDDADEPVVPVSLAGTGQLPPPECDIDVNPLSLDFGAVEVGTTATLSTTVGNTGGADCQVNALDLSGSTDFALNAGAPIPPFTVAPGATVDVPVDYTPGEEGDDAGTLDIGSNDPNENPVSVSLAGTGVVTPTPVCDIDVNPLSLDFGAVEAGTTATLATTIGNTGGANCDVNLSLTGSPDFSLGAGGPGTSFTVAPGTTVDVPVDYTPGEEGGDSGTLVIGSDDPDENPVNVALSGNGVVTPVVDLDITRFRVSNTSRAGDGKPIKINLRVKNNGAVDEPRNATVVGEQNGAEVYRTTIPVSAPVSGDGRNYDFPSYTPTAVGDIRWTATIADDDPDDDRATATTKVR